MSVGQATASVSYLERAITSTTVVSCSGWFYIEGSSSIPTLISVAPSNLNYYWIGINGSTYNIWHTSSGFSTTLGNAAIGQWVYAGLSLNGTTLTGYMSINNAASTTASVTVTSSSIIGARLLADWTPDITAARVCFARVWNTTMSQAEFDAEKNAASAVKQSGLISDSPLPNTSTLGGWTMTGGLSDSVDSPYVSLGFPTYWFRA